MQHEINSLVKHARPFRKLFFSHQRIKGSSASHSMVFFSKPFLLSLNMKVRHIFQIFCRCSLFEVRVVNLTTKPNIVNLKFFSFFICQLVTAKICFKSSYFWFLWQAKDQNIQLKTNYGR